MYIHACIHTYIHAYNKYYNMHTIHVYYCAKARPEDFSEIASMGAPGLGLRVYGSGFRH